MEGIGHVQHRSRSSLADNLRCPAQDRRFDRSKPFTLHALTRTRMRLLCYDPCDSFAYSRSAAGSRCTESFNAAMNPHVRASTTCRFGQTGSTRTGLAVWQQFVVATYIENISRERVRQIEARAIQKVRRTAHVASARRRNHQRPRLSARNIHSTNSHKKRPQEMIATWRPALAGMPFEMPKRRARPRLRGPSPQQLHNLKESPP